MKNKIIKKSTLLNRIFSMFAPKTTEQVRHKTDLNFSISTVIVMQTEKPIVTQNR
jgi:hypothetical protein